MKCPNCGANVLPEDRFCGECGTPIQHPKIPIQSTTEQQLKSQPKDIEKHVDHSTPIEVEKPSNQPANTENKVVTEKQQEIKEEKVASQISQKENNVPIVEQPQQNDVQATRSVEQHADQTSIQNNNLQNTQQQNAQQQNAQQQNAQYQNVPQQKPHQSHIDKEKLNQHAQEIKKEGAIFFKKLFRSQDYTIAERQPFSMKLILTITVLCALVSLLVDMLFFHHLLTSLEKLVNASLDTDIDKKLAMNVWFKLIFYVAISFGITYGIARLVVKDNLSVHKVYSDFIFINTISTIIYALGVFLTTLDMYKIGFFAIIIATFVFMNSTIFLITKYGAFYNLRIPSFYGVIIFVIVELLLINYFGHSIVDEIIDVIPREVREVITGIFDKIKKFFELVQGFSKGGGL